LSRFDGLHEKNLRDFKLERQSGRNRVRRYIPRGLEAFKAGLLWVRKPEAWGQDMPSFSQVSHGFDPSDPGFDSEEHSTIEPHRTNGKIVCHAVSKVMPSLGFTNSIGEGPSPGNDDAGAHGERIKPGP